MYNTRAIRSSNESGFYRSLTPPFFLPQSTSLPYIAPANVTNVAVSSVTSNSAKLTWNRPSNLPANVKRSYMILVRNSGIHQTTDREHVVFNDLRPYSQYEVSIRTEAVYMDVPYLSEESFVNFTTDVGVPGTVRNLNVAPRSIPHLLHVMWTPPADNVKNGPIDFYIIRVYNEQGQKISQT